MTEEKLTNIIDCMTRFRQSDSSQYYHLYNEIKERHKGDSFEVWRDIVHHTEYWEFPDDIETEVNGILQSGNVSEIVDYMVGLKYPDLINIFAFKMVLTASDLAVFCELQGRTETEETGYAIYSVLFAIFCNDKHKNTYKIADYVKVDRGNHFLRLFFCDLYNYKARNLEPVYDKILDDIVSLCNLADSYLTDNIGCILVLIEKGYASIKEDSKSNLLLQLDDAIDTYAFSLKEYSDAEERVVKARAKLITDLFPKNLLEVFETDMAKVQVRFEGWNITTETQYTSINKECVSLIMWLYIIGMQKMDTQLEEKIMEAIYNRLQQQINLVEHEDTYNLTMSLFIHTLDVENLTFDRLVCLFIEETVDFYFVLNVADGMNVLNDSHRKLLKIRWNKDKETTWMKVNQKRIWPDSFRQLISRLGLEE